MKSTSQQYREILRAISGAFCSSGRTVVLLLFAAVFSSPLIGCTTFDLSKWKQKPVPKADAKDPAVEILAIWQPAEGRGANGVPTRGFAGQILFFTRRHESPVEVNGDVRIYLFDDRGTVAEQSKPIHQYDFQADAWKTHLQISALGPSYQVFIPYPRTDGYQARCSLRVKLQPSDSPVIFSETANIVLSGPQLESTLTEDDSAGAEQSDEDEESAADTQFDQAAARKVITNGLKLKRTSSATITRSHQGRGRPKRVANSGEDTTNEPIARLKYVADRNGRQSVRAASADSAMPQGVMAEEEYDRTANAANEESSHKAAYFEEEVADSETPTHRLRLTQADGGRIATNARSAAARGSARPSLQQVGWEEVENSEPEAIRQTVQHPHPLADEEPY